MQKHMRRLSRKSLRLSAVCRNFGGINNGGTKCAASLQLIKHSFDVCSTIGFKHGDSKSWEMLRACLNKGLRSSPIMLNAGRGDLLGAEPGVDMAPTLSSPWGANNYMCAMLPFAKQPRRERTGERIQICKIPVVTLMLIFGIFAYFCI